MRAVPFRLWVALVVFEGILSGCFGVGAFRARDRSGTFRSDDQSNVRAGYERVHSESWTDVGEAFGVSIGFKPAFVFGPNPAGGPLGTGYGFDAHLNFRWRMLELTGGYAREYLTFADKSTFGHDSGVIGLHYYFDLPNDDEHLVHPYLGAAVQVGTVTRGSTEVEDIVGGRGTAGVAFVIPEVLWDNDVMLRVEGRFVGTQPVAIAPTPTSFLLGAVALEALVFF